MKLTSSPKASLPQFYRSVRPLDPSSDGRFKIKPTGFSFASSANAIPLGVEEIPLAARHYPIVFPTDGDAVVAVVGIREGQNLFVDEAGNWRPGAYVPAYVRRYPFIFHEDAKAGQLTLCVDDTAECLQRATGEPLFIKGQKSPALEAALAFALAFQSQHQAAISFARQLSSAGLLAERDAQITLSDGESRHLGGFRVVDEASFNDLDDSAFLTFRRNGWIGLVYCHLISLNNWATLVDMAALKKVG